MAKNSEWTEVGAILAKKDGSGFYLKVKKGVNVTLSEGDILQLQDPRARLDRMAANGHMNEEEAATRKAKIPDYIKFDVVLPPAKG